MDDSTAALSTDLLRTSKDPVFRRLREVLTEQGIDVEADVLAQFFPDASDGEFGVVVTTDHRVYTFVLRYGAGDLNTQAAKAVLHEWHNITDTWDASPYGTDVRDALELLQ